MGGGLWVGRFAQGGVLTSKLSLGPSCRGGAGPAGSPRPNVRVFSTEGTVVLVTRGRLSSFVVGCQQAAVGWALAPEGRREPV